MKDHMKREDNMTCEVLIVGGGPAGLSCALSIARGGGSLIICDNNNPRNKKAKSIRNLPGHEGITQSVYHELLKEDLLKYEKVIYQNETVINVEKKENHFYAKLSNGKSVKSKKVVFAEGLKDILPDILGIETFWGTNVFHCAYCHAYENIGKEFGMLASNEKAIQMLRLLRGISPNIKVFTNGKKLFLESDMAELEKMEITFFHEEILSLEGDHNELKGLLLKNKELVSCDTLFIQNKVSPKSEMGLKLGCRLKDNGIYEVNENGESSVEGVYFAGDVGSGYHSVIMASAVGSHVGICVNSALMKDLFNSTLSV